MVSHAFHYLITYIKFNKVAIANNKNKIPLVKFTVLSDMKFAAMAPPFNL